MPFFDSQHRGKKFTRTSDKSWKANERQGLFLIACNFLQTCEVANLRARVSKLFCVAHEIFFQLVCNFLENFAKFRFSYTGLETFLLACEMSRTIHFSARAQNKLLFMSSPSGSCRESQVANSSSENFARVCYLFFVCNMSRTTHFSARVQLFAKLV